jgi:hypothetical protein
MFINEEQLDITGNNLLDEGFQKQYGKNRESISINDAFNALFYEINLLKKQIKKLEEKNRERECKEQLEFSTKLYKID